MLSPVLDNFSPFLENDMTFSPILDNNYVKIRNMSPILDNFS